MQADLRRNNPPHPSSSSFLQSFAEWIPTRSPVFETGAKRRGGNVTPSAASLKNEMSKKNQLI
jgi:hypothetical protein